jgi:hypothetical protein
LAGVTTTTTTTTTNVYRHHNHQWYTRVGIPVRSITAHTGTINTHLKAEHKFVDVNVPTIVLVEPVEYGVVLPKDGHLSGYCSTQYSVSKDIPVQNIQSVGLFQYKMFGP